jgi:peptidoglycan hydrolase-like amidase
MLAALTLIHVSVFSLFHPTEFTVRPAKSSVLVVNNETIEGAQARTIKAAAKITGRNDAPADFILSVPNRITREFHGTLEVRREGAHLLAIVEMDIETAVASIVEGEAPGSGREARNAQAVAARSYLAATHGRHQGYDFCDTTHCQYLRGASAIGSVGNQAALDTRALTLVYQGRIVPALYSADCGGHTRSLKEAGWPDDGQGYPFFEVACPIKGPQRGHGIGLCQRGAMELARRGMGFREILAYFFPASTLVALTD